MHEQTKLDVEILKSEMTSVSKICEKMDGTLDKIQQVSVDLSKIVALQEQKHEMQDEINRRVEKKIEDEHNSTKEEVLLVKSKIDKVEAHLAEKIEEVSKERKLGYEKLTNKMAESEEKILKELATVKENVNKKVYEIDAWRYTIMGGIVLASFLITKFIDLAKIFKFSH